MTELIEKTTIIKEPYSRFFFVDEAGELSLVSSIHDARKAVRDGGYMWLDFCDPKKEDLEPLITELNLHPLSIEDSLNEEQLPKLDLFPNYSFMIFYFRNLLRRSVINEPDLPGKDFVVSVTHCDSQTAHSAGMERLVERESLKVRNESSFPLHLLIDTVVDRSSAIDRIRRPLIAMRTRS